MDASVILQAISTAFKGLQTVGDLIKANKQAEAATALADVQIKLGDLSSQCMQLGKMNLVLAKENAELKEKLTFAAKLVFKKPFYVTDSGDGPFCPKCYDDERKGIRLDGPHGGGYKRWDCPKCRNHFMENPDYKLPTAKSILDDY